MRAVRRRPRVSEATARWNGYLTAYRAPGVQHLALATDAIASTVRALRERGVGFLPVPASCYERVRQRIDDLDEEWEDFRALFESIERAQARRGNL